jgi:hypothetical protein
MPKRDFYTQSDNNWDGNLLTSATEEDLNLVSRVIQRGIEKEVAKNDNQNEGDG